jgi:hypothetical protein
MEVEMKRIIALLMPLVATATWIAQPGSTVDKQWKILGLIPARRVPSDRA